MEAIERIQRFVPISLEELAANEEHQVWFVHHLQIIGEAARSLSEPIREQIPDVPWRQWVGLRHILVHEYFGIDVAAVLQAISNDMNPLRESVGSWLEANPDE